MPATTGEDLITHAFETATIVSPGESIEAWMMNDGLRRLNLMMGALQLQPLSQPVQTREELTLTANKGGPSNPYTIGSGGDFNTTRPPTIDSVGILLVQSGDDVEVPRALLTDDAWQAIQIKELTATQFTNVYYNPTFSNDLGTINLWPVPNIATNKLVIYYRQPLTTFATLTTSYYLPPGCEEALEYNLARRLLIPYGVTDAETVEEVKELARTSLGTFKRGNIELSDLPTDPALTHAPGAFYNILTGTGGTGG